MPNNLVSASNELGGNVIVDIEEEGAGFCIHKIPKNLRKVNEEAYTPQLISIGPYFYGKKEFAAMIKHKRRFRNAFYGRITPDKRQNIKKFIIDREKRIRLQYSEPCWLPSEKFVSMILLDALFIIELFLTYCLRDRSDFLLEEVWVRGLRRDLQLLENQLPYFVLEEMYYLVFPFAKQNENCYPPFRYLSCVFFRLNLYHNIPPYDEAIKVKHFTDLCRQALVGSQSRKFGVIKKMTELPNVVKLTKSGVEFKVHGSDSQKKYLVDIHVEKGNQGMEKRKRGIPFYFFNKVELQIPRIYIEDNTESLIRNVMALEQFHYPSENFMCAYIDLMDFLIENEEDVDYLVKRRIISNYVGSNAVIVDMFNKLCRQVQSPSMFSCYSDVHNHLIEHYDHSWNHFMATLKSEYFRDPWRGAATVAALIILVLTLIQTVCSILQL